MNTKAKQSLVDYIVDVRPSFKPPRNLRNKKNTRQATIGNRYRREFVNHSGEILKRSRIYV